MQKNSFSLIDEVMKTISLWDVSLLLEAVVFLVFIVFVALEFCSTSYAMYLISKRVLVP